VFDGTPQEEAVAIRTHLDETVAPQMEKLENVASAANDLLRAIRSRNDLATGRTTVALVAALMEAHRYNL
jgi:hypothetical protein